MFQQVYAEHTLCNIDNQKLFRNYSKRELFFFYDFIIIKNVQKSNTCLMLMNS